MVVQDFLTASVQNKELQDNLYYYIWFEFLMNYDKIGIRDAYQREKEKQKTVQTPYSANADNCFLGSCTSVSLSIVSDSLQPYEL